MTVVALGSLDVVQVPVICGDVDVPSEYGIPFLGPMPPQRWEQRSSARSHYVRRPPELKKQNKCNDDVHTQSESNEGCSMQLLNNLH